MGAGFISLSKLEATTSLCDGVACGLSTSHESKTPASLSKLWITDILRKRIGYQDLIASDDLEMGGVLSAGSLGDSAVQFVAAGGDLCLVCHREDYVMQAYENLVQGW